MGLIDSLKKAFSKPYKTISVAQVKELLGSGATLIDVRSAQEWRTGRAPQAKHVPLDRLQTSTAGVQRTRPVIAVCLRRTLRLSSPAPGREGLRRLLTARRHGRLVPIRRTRPLTTAHTLSKENPMAEITITEAEQRCSTARVLDVREDFEVTEGIIPGALHIPMGQLQARLSELDPAVPVIAVCRSGNRSAAVADALNGAGYKAGTMAGGMTAWIRVGLPTT
jgi:rhodanese-related sulfurtransferase